MTRKTLATRLCPVALLLFVASVVQAQSATNSADLVVYGATASGVVTAYTAARQGYKVILLEPGSHIGGMVTGGLSATDVSYFPIIGAMRGSSTVRRLRITATIRWRITTTG